MIENARGDVLKVLLDVGGAIKSQNFAALHGLSDHIIHSLSIYQDKDIADVAIAIYALFKILEQEKYRAHPAMPVFLHTILELLKKARQNLQKDKIDLFRANIAELLSNIQGFSKRIKFYIQDVLSFARIKKGTRLYEHGLSLGAAAKAMGITKRELAAAVGETVVHERFVEPIVIEKKRLEKIFKLFKIKKKKK